MHTRRRNFNRPRPATPTAAARLFNIKRLAVLAVVGLLAAAPDEARAWGDAAWPMRRMIDLKSQPGNIAGNETALVRGLFPQRTKADASDLRVTTDDGRPVPLRIVNAGDDDTVTFIFNPVAGKTKYVVYWGNKADKLPAVEPATVTSGLFVEGKPLVGGPPNSIDGLKKIWEGSGRIVGGGMIDRPFVGYNPAGILTPSVCRITGILYAPSDGEYQIAISADDAGGLILDDKAVLFAPGFPDDIRFNKKIKLTRGGHRVEYYHYDGGGDWRLTIGWRRPNDKKIDPIDADSFGRMVQATLGRLEVNKQSFVADMNLEHGGECIIDERSVFQKKFNAVVPDKASAVRVEWNFGDGQTGSGKSVDHVFLQPGVFEVSVKVKATQGESTQKFKIDIGRDPDALVDPKIVEPKKLADIVSAYDPQKLEALQRAVLTRLLARSGKDDATLKALKALCGTRKNPDQRWAVDAVEEAIDSINDEKDLPALAAALAALRPDSNLQPKAAILQAEVLLWRLGDFKQAAAVLEPFKNRDSRTLDVLSVMALLLDGQADKVEKALQKLPPEEELGRAVAISGAMARSVEYFVDNGESETAADKWLEWQRKFPRTFLDGYSVLLKVRMMSKRYPKAAAAVAEKFASAVPDSAYAPSLIDRAASLLEKTDAQKSTALRQLLKEKYPEDPLSQPGK